MWQIKPFLFLCLKSSVAFLLFFLVFRFFRKRYFSIRGSFYTAASMMFLILTTVTLTIIDVSFSYYFAWAFVFSFAYSLMRRRYLKLILLGLAPFWLLMAVYDVFTLPALRVVEVVLFSRITGNLLFALVVLPFVLMLLRLSLLYKHAVGKRQKVQNLILLLFFGVSALVLAGHIYVLDPFTHRNQPVLLEESIDIPGGNRSLVITSPSPIDELSVFGGGYSRRLRDVAGESVIPGGPIPELLSVKQKVEPFLDRRYVILTINFEGSPWKTRARLEGDRQIIVYDGNFPFATDIGEMSAEFFIGNNPPNPLILEFTVPRDTAFVLKLDVIYKQFPYSLTIEGENKEITTFLYVKDEINFL